MPKKSENSVRTVLGKMETGEQVVFPAEKTSYVRTLCVTCGFEWDKKFTTKVDREERTITVTREA